MWDELQVFLALQRAMLFFVPLAFFVALLFLDAPYGRHFRKGFGPKVNGRVGWMVMELVSPLVFVGTFFWPTRPPSALLPAGYTFISFIFLAMWVVHYVNRALVYPLRLPAVGPSSAAVVATSILFNVVNAYLNARAITCFHVYRDVYVMLPNFIIGINMWTCGFLINVVSDNHLIALRNAPPEEPKEDETRPQGAAARRRKRSTARDSHGRAATEPAPVRQVELDADGHKSGEGVTRRYFIPTAGLFELISCPNYFGEILEWLGWAIATASLPGMAFFLCTIANLVPRALQNHRWYLTHFGTSYPPRRKAIIPYIL